MPKQEGPLDVVIDILNENVEHKKMTHPYLPPQVQTVAEIETETRQIDDEFAKLKVEYDRVNDTAAEKKKQDEITDLVDDIIDESNTFQNLNTADIWIDDDISDYKDHPDIVDTSKDILKAIRENDPLLDFNIPTDAIIEDLLQPSDDEDNDLTIEDLFDPSDEEPEFIIAEQAVPEDEIIRPDTNSVSIDTGPKQSKKYITTIMKGSVRAAERVKEKYKNHQRKKQIGQLNKQNKASACWLKAAGYLDTKDQDAIRYIFNVPRNNVSNNSNNNNNDNNNNNNKPTEPVGDIIDLKKSSGATQLVAKNIVRKYRNLARKKSY